MRKHCVAAMLLAASTLMAQDLLPYQNPALSVEERVEDALSRMTLQEKCRLSYAQSKFTSPGVPRLGIPELWMSDGPHGVRPEINWNDWGYSNWTSDSVTAFPALTCLAATWNPEMAALYGKAVGEEARYRKKDVLLGPGVNVYRTPLNGRNFEYLGEDPYLASRMCVPYIQEVQKNGVSTCIKHYILNEQEEYRGHVDVRVSDRALHEIYLPAFVAALREAHPWSLMGSYNKYRGQHATHNKWLINDLLKGKLQYDGAVITDWGAAHDTREAALYGTDLEMGSYTNGLTTEATGFSYNDYYLGTAYYEMAKSGEIPMEVVNDKARRMLRLLFRTAVRQDKPMGALNSPEHLEVARQIAEEGIVLLKNDAQLLPLQAEKYRKVLVVGENAERALCPGGGSSELKAKDEVSVLRGLKERFPNWQITYKPGYRSGIVSYHGIDDISDAEQSVMRQEALEAVSDADLVIYVGGMNKNHFEDCEGGDRRYFNLSYGQDKLIGSLAATGKPMLTIIISGNAYAMPWLPQVTTLVQSWYLGSEAGHAMARVLSGDVCPSGKVPFTYAADLYDYPAHQFGKVAYPGVSSKELPAAYDYGKDGVPASADLLKALKKHKADKADLNQTIRVDAHNGNGDEIEIYAEDIMVGYRYFDTYKRPVVFPFGYGLSYTSFAYSNLRVEPLADGRCVVRVDVQNTGKVAGKEIVQVYVRDVKASVVRPEKELKGFQKLSLLPGETKTATIELDKAAFSFYDEIAHDWVVEPGDFSIMVGRDSRAIFDAKVLKL